VGAAMVYFSTDYVFNGKGETPFEVNSPKDGLSVYGKSKSLGEDYVIQTLSSYFIVRISWVFGLNGRNFLKAILNLATSGAKEITVVNDQVGSITYSVDLARLIVDMIETDRYGVYHATNEGFVSRSDLVRELLNQAGCPVPIKEVTTEEYNQMVPAQADRPLNSRLDKSSLDRGGFARLPDWKNAISRYLIELNMQTKKGDKK
jgi:dTDP-4-dehydrorhamnose reductase